MRYNLCKTINKKTICSAVFILSVDISDVESRDCS